MKLTFKHTQLACYMGYISQAVTTTFLPLLFVRLTAEFGFSLAQLTVLITITFFCEIFIDAVCPLFINKIGYRTGMMLANICGVLGTAGLAFFPFIFKNPYIGFIICDVLYAIGGGFDEVLISPIVEACPTDNKAGAMGLLHSFYCWGCAAIVLLSTLFFRVAGIENWRILAVLWALVPLANIFLFALVPIRTLEEEKGNGKFSDMLKNPLFWLMGIVMICAGASELAMSQWASAFAETGLGVSKTVGDLLGPCAFAVLMGTSRVIYSKISNKTDITKILIAASFVCIGGYLLASVSGSAMISLIGCAVCGIAVAPMWPGAFSIAAKHIPKASTAMFAAFALAGDLGCTAGPSIVGFVSGADSNIAEGLLVSIVFPAVMIICLLFVRFLNKKKS